MERKRSGRPTSASSRASQAGTSAVSSAAQLSRKNQSSRRTAARRAELLPREILTEEEKLRQGIYGKTLADIASRDSRLLDLRRQLLDSRCLKAKELKDTATNVALRHFDPEWFYKRKIPIIGHLSSYRSYQDMRFRHGLNRRRTVVVELHGKKTEYKLPSEAQSKTDDSVTMRHPKADLNVHRLSVLGKVQALADVMAKSYGWEEADAALFILDGTTPPTPAISLSNPYAWSGYGPDHTHFTITLKIAPWVSPETVKGMFQHIQRRHLRMQSRKLDVKTLSMFKCVQEQFEQRGIWWPAIVGEKKRTGRWPRLPWGDISKDWNKKHEGKPGWETTGREVGITFRRAYEDIMFGQFVPFGVKLGTGHEARSYQSDADSQS